jgi:fructokinase
MQLPVNKKVLCFGEVLWDVLPTGAKPGGAPMNVAIHLKNMGIDVELVSSIGNDTDGEALKDFMKSTGISLKYIQTQKDLPTSTVQVKLDSLKNATYEICEPVAWDNISMTPELKYLKKEVGLIIFGSLASRNTVTRKTLEYILDTDAIKLLDVNLRSPYDNKEIIEQLLYKSDIAKLNDDELNLISRWHTITGDEKDTIKWLTEKYNLNIAIVTRGSKGAIVYNEGVFTEHCGYKVLPVDTVGAGDSFLAAYTSKLLNGNSDKESIEFACATGAYVALQEGATPKFTNQDIVSFMKTNK